MKITTSHFTITLAIVVILGPSALPITQLVSMKIFGNTCFQNNTRYKKNIPQYGSDPLVVEMNWTLTYIIGLNEEDQRLGLAAAVRMH